MIRFPRGPACRRFETTPGRSSSLGLPPAKLRGRKALGDSSRRAFLPLPSRIIRYPRSFHPRSPPVPRPLLSRHRAATTRPSWASRCRRSLLARTWELPSRPAAFACVPSVWHSRAGSTGPLSAPSGTTASWASARAGPPRAPVSQPVGTAKTSPRPAGPSGRLSRTACRPPGRRAGPWSLSDSLRRARRTMRQLFLPWRLLTWLLV